MRQHQRQPQQPNNQTTSLSYVLSQRNLIVLQLLHLMVGSFVVEAFSLTTTVPSAPIRTIIRRRRHHGCSNSSFSRSRSRSGGRGMKLYSSSSEGDESNKVVEPRQFVDLTNPLDGMMLDDDIVGNNVALSSLGSKLPASFIRSWPTWILEVDGTWTRIPDSSSTVNVDGGGNDDDSSNMFPTGHVDPTSIDELWSPIDLKRPQMKLALGLHVRSGMIRHVLPALDIGYVDNDQKKQKKDDVSLMYRNRGMCSVPRAYTWMEFLGRYGRFKMVASSRKIATSSGDDDGDDQEWSDLLQSSGTGHEILDAIDRATLALTADSVPDEIGDGSHIVHVLLQNEDDAENGSAVDIPRSGHELKVSMVAVTDPNTTTNDQKMIETKEDRMLREQRQEVARLQVVVSSTMPGSESQYLPEVYKELYNTPELRNQKYDRYKARRTERKSNSNR